MSSDLYEIMEKVLSADIVNRHSYFQLKYFVVGKEPTHQSKLWRCLKELQARAESLEGIKIEVENSEDDLVLCHIEVERLNLALKAVEERLEVDSRADGASSPPSLAPLFQLEEKELHVKIKRSERRVKSVEKHLNTFRKRLKEVEEEATFFIKSFLSLEALEALKPFDDLESQQLYWNEKFAEELNLRHLLGQPVSYELIKSILSLNNESPIKIQIVNTLEKKQSVILESLGTDKDSKIVEEKHGN